MKKAFLLALLVFSAAVLFAGCSMYNDPSTDELRKAENIDIERMQGTVASKDVRYYVGDMPETKEKKGQPYYCITIAPLNSRETVEFRGVPANVFDYLTAGMELPQTPLLTMQYLAKIEGRIADKIPYPEKNKFFIVIDDYATVKLYRVDMATYYSKRVFVEAKLPLSPNEEAQ